MMRCIREGTGFYDGILILFNHIFTASDFIFLFWDEYIVSDVTHTRWVLSWFVLVLKYVVVFFNVEEEHVVGINLIVV